MILKTLYNYSLSDFVQLATQSSAADWPGDQPTLSEINSAFSSSYNYTAITHSGDLWDAIFGKYNDEIVAATDTEYTAKADFIADSKVRQWWFKFNSVLMLTYPKYEKMLSFYNSATLDLMGKLTTTTNETSSQSSNGTSGKTTSGTTGKTTSGENEKTDSGTSSKTSTDTISKTTTGEETRVNSGTTGNTRRFNDTPQDTTTGTDNSYTTTITSDGGSSSLNETINNSVTESGTDSITESGTTGLTENVTTSLTEQGTNSQTENGTTSESGSGTKNSTVTTDGALPMEKLKMIQENYRNILNDWVNEFRQLFIEDNITEEGDYE